MADGTGTTPFGNVPPWVWVMLLLGGGGSLGTLTGLEMGTGHEDKCAELEARVNEAEAARAAMSASISALTDVIKQCNPGTGWIE